MGIWTDIAQWVGPTPNRGGAMIEWRGVVIHIAEGSYEGTISWQKNDSSNVSSHFIVAKDGRIAQMVDTDQVAWTQAGGNGRWLSIENEGFSGQSLTPAQLEANAKIIAKAHKIYGFPLILAESPTGKGIGWHGMGGAAWGNHPNCPGVPIRNQRPEMIAIAQRILGGAQGGSGKMALGDRMIRQGDEGDDVWELQNSLSRLGYTVGPHWGVWERDGATTAAVKAFQQKTWPGTPAEWDGIVGPKTASAIKAAIAALPAPAPPPPSPPIPPAENVNELAAALAVAMLPTLVQAIHNALNGVKVTATIQRPE